MLDASSNIFAPRTFPVVTQMGVDSKMAETDLASAVVRPLEPDWQKKEKAEAMDETIVDLSWPVKSPCQRVPADNRRVDPKIDPTPWGSLQHDADPGRAVSRIQPPRNIRY